MSPADGSTRLLRRRLQLHWGPTGARLTERCLRRVAAPPALAGAGAPGTPPPSAGRLPRDSCSGGG
eukprot:2365583-Pyramimonas_sp.AAC.1